MAEIEFFSEDTPFTLENQTEITAWLEAIASKYEQEILYINYIYCSDNYLLEINKTYLDHDYFTDIITFDQRDNIEEPIEADIFISIDRVEENAKDSKTTFETELNRVMAHGLLHLIGFNDKTEEQKTEMRKTEEACLSLLKN